MFMNDADFLSSELMTSLQDPPPDDADNEISGSPRGRRDTAQHSVAAHVIFKRRTLSSDTDYGL